MLQGPSVSFTNMLMEFPRMNQYNRTAIQLWQGNPSRADVVPGCAWGWQWGGWVEEMWDDKKEAVCHRKHTAKPELGISEKDHQHPVRLGLNKIVLKTQRACFGLKFELIISFISIISDSSLHSVTIAEVARFLRKNTLATYSIFINI